MSRPATTEYPESDKLVAFRTERSAIVDFVDWLASEGLLICELDGEGRNCYWPASVQTDTLVMRYLGVDEVTLEEERRDMLIQLRCTHPIDMFAPRCAEISCPNYAGKYSS